MYCTAAATAGLASAPRAYVKAGTSPPVSVTASVTNTPAAQLDESCEVRGTGEAVRGQQAEKQKVHQRVPVRESVQERTVRETKGAPESKRESA